MTIQDKARRYEEALERAKQLLRYSVAYDRFTIEKIFPEINESDENDDNDDKVRKVLVDYFKRYKEVQEGCGDKTFYGIPTGDILIWLENNKRTHKPMWTEEDNSMQIALMNDIERLGFVSRNGKDELIMWINKFDDRVYNIDDSLSKWTYDDEKKYIIVDFLLFEHFIYIKEEHHKIKNWLESIKQRLNGK